VTQLSKKSSNYQSTKSSRNREEIEESMFESRIYENDDNFIYKTMTKKVFRNNDLFKQLSSQFILNLSR